MVLMMNCIVPVTYLNQIKLLFLLPALYCVGCVFYLNYFKTQMKEAKFCTQW